MDFHSRKFSSKPIFLSLQLALIYDPLNFGNRTPISIEKFRLFHVRKKEAHGKISLTYIVYMNTIEEYCIFSCIDILFILAQEQPKEEGKETYHARQ